MRWQFIGGMPEDQRRAFLFTNVIDSKGRKYDMPVVVGALASSPAIYALGMGRPVEEIGERLDGRRSRIRSRRSRPTTRRARRSSSPATNCAAGRRLKRLPVPVSTPGFDAAPYLTATLCVTGIRIAAFRTCGTYRAALKAADRAGGAHGRARGGGAGGYLHWLKYRERKEKMPIAIVVGAAPIVMFTGPQKLAVDSTRWRWPAGSPARRSA